jgi:hypothetical protein
MLKSADYARAKIPMLPVVAGLDATRRQILGYTLVLAPVGVAPAIVGFAGIAYGVTATVAGLLMLRACGRGLSPCREGQAAAKACGRLFGFSILYLFALFGVLLLELVFARAGLTFASMASLLRAGPSMTGLPPDRRMDLTTEEQKRRRSRSFALGLVLAGLVLLFYFVTIAKLGPGVVTDGRFDMRSPDTDPNIRRTGIICAGVIARHGRPVICLCSPLRSVLPGHRIWRHADGCNPGGRPNRPAQNDGALRFECRARPAVAVYAGYNVPECPARRDANRILHGAEHRRHSADRGCRLQCAARASPAPISTRFSASASRI